MMDKRAFDNQHSRKINQLLIVRVLLSLVAGSAVSLMVWYISKEQGFDLNMILPVVIGILLTIIIATGSSYALFADAINKEKIVEQKAIQKKSNDSFFKQMESPVSARCTQKQSFGTNAQQAPGKYEVKAGDESISLSPDLYETLSDGDEVKIHRAAKSGLLLRIEKG